MKNLFLVALLSVLLSACSVIGPGQRGVRTYFGSMSPTILQPGLHLWFPVILGLTKIDVQIQKSEINTNAASKDMQDVTTKFALNWHLTPDQVGSVFQNIGDEDSVLEKVISPAISEVLKAATAKKTAEEILTKRHELKAEIDVEIRKRMKGYGITIDDINIVNVSFSHEFSKAIENKQIAEQRAKEAEYEALRAEKDAQSEVNRAKGQAEAQRLLQKTLTKDLLTLEYLKKWNGELPQVLTGGGSGVMLNLNINKGAKSGKSEQSE